MCKRPPPLPHTQWQGRGQLPAPQVALGMWGINVWDFGEIDVAKGKAAIATRGVTEVCERIRNRDFVFTLRFRHE